MSNDHNGPETAWQLEITPKWLKAYNTTIEAQVSLYRSPDINKPSKNVCMPNTSKFYYSNPIGFYNVC
jgi:hypothetical protein